MFFDNTLCLSCERELGFCLSEHDILTLVPAGEDVFQAPPRDRPYKKCHNYVKQGVCNWLLSADDPAELCQACGLNRVIPNLSEERTREQWARVETAKRRLLYSLHRLQLPIASLSDSPSGMAFDIKADIPGEHVITGHADGLITLNVAEADPVVRERLRVELEERYRTLLGHMRHEIGHYYWELLVRDSPCLDAFRALFGDERADYSAALKAHYDSPDSDWPNNCVSAYASAHPWEDWAETWAHYLHITDTLETAHHFGLGPSPDRDRPFATVVNDWLELTVALNALNRSMGMPDPYPFQIPDRVREKLAFVHRVITEGGASRRGES